MSGCAKTAPPGAALQEGRAVLVGPGRAPLQALAVEDGQEMAWFWIGSHAEYDRLISQP
jgi:hypothetical protein